MRNLKRVLSLTLAAVMLLGMMVIGSSAATDYPDVDYDNDNVEAIEVLEAINVMTGYPEDGTFKPGNEVSRAEMARIMAALMDLEYDYYVGANPFTDMAGHWAEGYAAACAANGIIAGRTTTTYDPSATVTAVEAAAMLMRALGYFQNREVDYADGFEISTVRQAGRINLFDKVDVKTNEPMTRNDVAQLILNTLQSGMVEPDKNGTLSVTTPDGFTVATGATNYVYTIARNNTVGQAINDTTAADGNSTSGLRGFILDLGEQLYNGELKLKKDEQDVFGRPSRKWEFKGKEIGTYRKVELHEETYSVKVTGKMLYDLLGASTIADYDLDVFIDGVDTTPAPVFTEDDLTRTNDETVGQTGKGVTTEVYVDTENKIVTVVIINTYLAKAQDDYDERNDDLDLTVYNVLKQGGDYYKNNTTDEFMTVSGEDFPITDAEKDDLCLVQIAQGEIQVMQAPEILSAVIIDAFRTGRSGYVSTDGTQYDRASTGRYDVEVLDLYDQSHLKEITYNIILDQYGYMIGLEKNEDPDQYVFLTGIDAGASNLYASTAKANVIHLDGTMETVEVNMTKSRNANGTDRLLTGYDGNYSQVNSWCKYSINDNGVYTLRMINDATGSTAKVINGTTIKVAQFAQDVDVYDDSNTGGSADTKEINEKRVSLVAYGDDLGNAGGYVYGNDDTVYLNVSLKDVEVKDSTGGEKRWIIDDVDTVTVGIKNVNIEVRDLVEIVNTGSDYISPDAEIYTLYNDKGIVIAAVTIGQDSGTSSSFAYITTNDVRREEYGHTSGSKSTEGKWTWYRDAIVDGVKTSLTQTGDAGTMDLDQLNRGEWYEIRYTTNGDVRRHEWISDSNSKAEYHYSTTSASPSNWKYINAAQNVELAMASVSGNTVLLHDQTTVDQLRFDHGTLYTAQDDTKGFYVSESVKTVVSNASKDGGTLFDDIVDGYNGWTGVEKAIRDMNSRGNVVPVTSIELSAILVNGQATVIVINDKNPETGTTSSAGSSATSPAGKVSWTAPAVSPLGEVTTRFTLTSLADWVIGGSGNSVTITGDVWINGKNVGSIGDGLGSDVEIDAVKNVQTGSTSLGYFSGYNLLGDNTVELKNVTVNAQFVKARILDSNNRVLFTSDEDDTTNTQFGADDFITFNGSNVDNSNGVPTVYANNHAGNGNAKAITFKWNNTTGISDGARDFDILRAKVISGTTGTKTFVIGTEKTLNTSTWLAEGTGYVDIKLDTTGATKSYTVTMPEGESGTGDSESTAAEWDEDYDGEFAAATLSIIVVDDPDGAPSTDTEREHVVTAGDQVAIRVADEGSVISADQAYGLKIVLKIGGVEETLYLVNDGNSNTGVDTDTITVNKDIEVEVVSITDIEAPQITGVEVRSSNNTKLDANDTLRVYFSKAVNVTHFEDAGIITSDTTFKTYTDKAGGSRVDYFDLVIDTITTGTLAFDDGAITDDVGMSSNAITFTITENASATATGSYLPLDPGA